jgi:hypothetical protein
LEKTYYQQNRNSVSMILYVNGDSHSAAGEAVNPSCFAEDDHKYRHLGRRPHPINLEVSYGKLLSDCLSAKLVCEAESASSNDRIIRTTLNYLKTNCPDLVVIGWSTWEREEWLFKETYYQVSAGGHDRVPMELKEKYQRWVIDQNEYTRELKMVQTHHKIYQLHQTLLDQNIKHLFFNTYSDFSAIKDGRLKPENRDEVCFEWGDYYISPYEHNMSFYFWLQQQGIKTVNPNSYHYGPDGHKKWAEFLLPYLTRLL